MPASVRQHFQGPHSEEDLRDLGLTTLAPFELYRADPIEGFEPPVDEAGTALPHPVPALVESALGIHVKRNPLAMLLEHPQLSIPWSRYASAAPLEVDHATRKQWSAFHLRAWLAIVASHHRLKDAESKGAPPPSDDPEFTTAGGQAL